MFPKLMSTIAIKKLNKAEKSVLFAVFAAIMVFSGRPQATRAAGLSLAMIDSAPALDAGTTTTQTITPITIKKTMVVVATAYSSTPDQTDASPFTTSNGTAVYDGLIAANWLPYNTKIRIPDIFGDKVFTVNDRMNERYNTGRLDVWMKTRGDAKIFGIRHIRIQIVE